MLVRDIGEFGVIERLNRMIVRRGAGNDAVRRLPIEVDTGDDTAVWRVAETRELFTTDTMVEGVHFTRETTPWKDLGWKAIASNISDVASMGGLPTYALITLGLPPEARTHDIEEMYRGMLEIGEEYGMGIVGGDIVRSPVLFVTTGPGRRHRRCADAEVHGPSRRRNRSNRLDGKLGRGTESDVGVP